MSKRKRNNPTGPAELAAPVQASGPYDEIGATGLKAYMGFVNEAYNSSLYWPAVQPLYSRIRRSNPEIAVVRQIYTALTRKVGLAFDLPDTPSDDDKRAQEFGNQVLDDIEGGVTGLLETVVSQVPFMGWGWWEVVPGVRSPSWTPPADDEWRSQYDDGRIGYRRIAWRDTSSFWGWDMDSAGRVRGMVQSMPVGTTAPLTRTLPSSRSLHLRFGDSVNPEGLSPLEAVYRLERIKYGLEVISGIGFEHAAGYLSVKKTSDGTFSPDDMTKIDRAARAILSAKEGNYATWPNGVEGQVMDIPFQAAASLLENIKYYGVLKLTTYNMQWVALSATTGAGSYSAMDDSSSMFVLTFNAMLEGFADQMDAQIGRRLFALNDGAFPGMTRRPRLKVTPIEKAISLAELGQFLQAIGWMQLGPDDIKAIRRHSGFLSENLPEGADEQPKKKPPVPPQNDDGANDDDGEKGPQIDPELAHAAIGELLHLSLSAKGGQ